MAEAEPRSAKSCAAATRRCQSASGAAATIKEAAAVSAADPAAIAAAMSRRQSRERHEPTPAPATARVRQIVCRKRGPRAPRPPRRMQAQADVGLPWQRRSLPELSSACKSLPPSRAAFSHINGERRAEGDEFEGLSGRDSRRRGVWNTRCTLPVSGGGRERDRGGFVQYRVDAVDNPPGYLLWSRPAWSCSLWIVPNGQRRGPLVTFGAPCRPPSGCQRAWQTRFGVRFARSSPLVIMPIGSTSPQPAVPDHLRCATERAWGGRFFVLFILAGAWPIWRGLDPGRDNSPIRLQWCGVSVVGAYLVLYPGRIWAWYCHSGSSSSSCACPIRC